MSGNSRILVMAGRNRIRVASYNLHGIMQGFSYLLSLCNDYDIIYVQEHWLAPFDLNSLDEISNDMICYSSSALCDVIAKGCLKGRPFGGVAIFVKNSLATKTRLIKAATRYIILQHDDTIFINVYLPCKASVHREEELTDCLASILHDLTDLHFTDIIFGGDLNIDFSETDYCHDIVLSFAEELGLKFVDDKIVGACKNTFRVESTGASSAIDHFAVTQNLYDFINEVVIIDSGINLSDHCPVILDVCINTTQLTHTKHKTNATSQQLNYRWDKGDIVQYYYLTHDRLCSIIPPVYLMHDANVNCHTKSDILEQVNRFYTDIVHALHSCARLTIPRKRHNFYKYWWDEELSILKEKAI